jgi:hypothetical protein
MRFARSAIPSRWLSVALNLGDLRVEPCFARPRTTSTGLHPIALPAPRSACRGDPRAVSLDGCVSPLSCPSW